MTVRTLMLAAAGVAALSLAACNRPAEETATTGDAAMDAEATTATGDAAAGGTAGGAAASGSTAGGSNSGGGRSASSGGSGSTASSGAGSTSSTSGSVAVTGQVDSAIPADAPSRNTRETQAAAGTNTGETAPYAYSPTNPRVDPKR
ncbi:MAG TPA: hypothetical protein VGR32_11720 [Brevundimonas sp.]|uniref:hypothetical protein n=1 Tax=Brevundimonas sp. TaxID=1871086 RepID=UPI002DE51557|nr:hypothetical protein [Brevundimonas sp.]